MPIYEYLCVNCNKVITKIQSNSKDYPNCPDCDTICVLKPSISGKGKVK